MSKKLASIILSFLLVLCASLCACDAGSEGLEKEAGVEASTNYLDYVDVYISSKIEKINGIAENNEIDKSFYFITDLHWETNQKNSPYFVNKIRNATNVQSIVFGGDYIEHDYDNKSEALGVMKDCVDAFTSDDYVAIIGNHETNREYWIGTEVIDDKECIGVLNKNRFDNSYFSVDDNTQKISCIYLNTNIFTRDSDQYIWLQDKLTSLGEDWTTIVFMHVYNHSALAGICLQADKQGKLIDELLNENKDRIKCNIAGIFSGHTHRDYFGYNSFGCPIVSTTCDSLGTYYYCDFLYSREANTVTEQGFDVVQIDTSQRKVFMTRIGAGVDRTYFY